MFESLFTFRLAIHRHQSAPLRLEREQFLEHLRRQGLSDGNLRQCANKLVYIVHFLRLRELRSIGIDEIKHSAELWLKKRVFYRTNTFNPCAIYQFTGIAKHFLKFHRKLIEPPKPPQPFPDKLDRFVDFLTVEKGLRPETIKAQRWHASQFLKWYATHHKKFSAACLKDTDSYMLERSEKWTGWTLREAAHVLRNFFRYARSKHWCRRVPAEAIKGPFLRKSDAPFGPSWFDSMFKGYFDSRSKTRRLP
jgi:integrase/recombinase XerD